MGRDASVHRKWCISGAEFVTIGDSTSILEGLRIEAIAEYAGVRYEPQVVIGKKVYIGRHAFFTIVNRLEIGDECVLSDYVYITDEFHGFDPRQGRIMEQPLQSKGPVIIGRGCFLGYRSAIMPGVSLGDHCVVGSNTVVTRSFGPYSMVAGSPARIIKRFDLHAGQWLASESEIYNEYAKKSTS